MDYTLSKNMAIYKRFLPPIPKGFMILCGGVDVAGIHHRKDDAIAFIKGKDPSLEIAREPKNQFDTNAIVVFGITKGFFAPKRRKIGYIPAEIAKTIVDESAFDSILPRLRQVRLSDDGFCAVELDLICPK
jgi:HIRAN domain